MTDERTKPQPFRVTVTADDFGLTASVNEAVERAHRSGVLTSASLMVAGGAASDAVDRARRMPTLCVGLHVVVADGQPVSRPTEIPSLVDRRGQLPRNLVRASLRYFLRADARRQLRAEVRAQFQAFRATGLMLEHVDTHHHLVLHPTVLGIILELAPEFGIRVVRLPAEPWRATRGAPLRVRAAAAVRVACLAPWLATVRLRLRRAGIACNREVRGLAETGAIDEATLLRLISTVDRDGTEIFLHPATDSLSSVPLPQPIGRHVAELEALCSPRARAALEKLGAEPVGLHALARVR